MAGDWQSMTAAQAFVINPRIQPPRALSLPFVDMAAVDGNAQYVEASETRGLAGGSRFEDGDTLMARITPCLENGKIARFRSTERHSFGFGSTEFIVFRGRDGVTTSDFAFYTVKSQLFRDFAISQMSGTSGRQRVPTTCFEHLHLSIPPISTQHAITAVLSALDEKIDLNRQMAATLEEMARALFKSWFVDFDPVHAKAEGRDTGLPADIAALFPDSFDDEGLPDGWRSGSLDDLADTNSESWKASSHPEEVDYVDLSNCKWGNIDGTTQYRWEYAPSRARRVARAGDTIFGSRKRLICLRCQRGANSQHRICCLAAKGSDLSRDGLFRCNQYRQHPLARTIGGGSWWRVSGCKSRQGFSNCGACLL